MDGSLWLKHVREAHRAGDFDERERQLVDANVLAADRHVAHSTSLRDHVSGGPEVDAESHLSCLLVTGQ